MDNTLSSLYICCKMFHLFSEFGFSQVAECSDYTWRFRSSLLNKE